MKYSEEEKKAFETLEYFEPDDLVECSIYLKSIKTIKKLIDKHREYIKKYGENYKKTIKMGKKIDEEVQKIYNS